MDGSDEMIDIIITFIVRITMNTIRSLREEEREREVR